MGQIKIGNLSLKAYQQKISLNECTTVTDIMVTTNYLYVANCNLDKVEVYSNNSGALGSHIASVDWYSDDNNIGKVCAHNSSVPYAFTTYTKDGKNYFIGWSGSSANIYIWEINSSHLVCNRKVINAPTTMSAYSRAGWDGLNTIYFVKIDRNGSDMHHNDLYKLELDSNSITLVSSSVLNPKLDSSYTGSGLYVDNDFIYIGGGANESNGFLGALNYRTKKVDHVIKGDELKKITNGEIINSEAGNISINAYNKVAYYFYASNLTVYTFPVSGFKVIDEVITTNTSCNFRVPKSLQDGDKLRVKVRAGVKIGGVIYYGDEAVSSPISVYTNDPPSNPTNLQVSKSKVKVGDKNGLSWSPSTDTDGDSISYVAELYNGTAWISVTGGTSNTSFTHNIPAMQDTTQAKYRVKAGDGKDYSDWVESGVFTVYNNNIPSNPSAFSTPTLGQKIKPLQVMDINWGKAVDKDSEDTLSYFVEFFNGTDWAKIGDGISDTNLKFMIPKIKGIKNAKFRVKAYDGKDYSESIESNEFEIVDVDLSKLSTPNAINFDGKDDKISLGNPSQINSLAGGLTILLKKVRVKKTGESYPLICKMANVDKPAYYLGVDESGSLEFNCTDTGGSIHVVHAYNVCDKWMTVEVYYDSNKKLFGLKIDGKKIVEHDSLEDGKDLISSDTPCEIGYDYTVKKYGNFQLSGVSLFNRALTDEESKKYLENKIVGNEDGLVSHYIFDDINGTTILDKTSNSNNVELEGGALRAFQFALLKDLKMPSNTDPQRKVNIEYLRTQVNQFRLMNGLKAVEWTDSTILEGTTPIKAIHLNELQTAIIEVYNKLEQHFKNSDTEKSLKEAILAHSEKYDVKKLPIRFQVILKGLGNE